MSKKMCRYCKDNVVWYYRSDMCKDCAINFFDKKETENEHRQAN